MDTMLHELCHIVHGEHDKSFYGLLDELKREWEILSAKGYQGEGFFSQGQKLGKGHMWYRPSLAVSSTDRKRVKEMAERKARGEIKGPGVPLGGPGIPVGGEVGGGRRLGGTPAMVLEQWDPKQLAAMAAEQRSRDQRRCGQKHGGRDMQREKDKADRQGKQTQVKDIPHILDLNDMQDYDLEDLPVDLTPVPVANGLGRAVYRAPSPAPSPTPSPVPSMANGGLWQSDWACTRCTLRNPPLYLACQACEAERDLQGVGTDLIDLTANGGTNSWDCKACTFRNDNVMGGICSVCGTEKE
jgi:hypothetical protein